MKRTSPDFLRCPICSGELNLDPSTADLIETASLTCQNCRDTWFASNSA